MIWFVIIWFSFSVPALYLAGVADRIQHIKCGGQGEPIPIFLCLLLAPVVFSGAVVYITYHKYYKFFQLDLLEIPGIRTIIKIPSWIYNLGYYKKKDKK